MATMMLEIARPGTRHNPFARLAAGRILPVLVVSLALLAIWYVATIGLNARGALDQYERDERNDWTIAELIADTMRQERPLLPAPHQILVELDKSVLQIAPTSRRSLVYHGWVTLSAAFVGFAMGTLLGIVLAIAIVHVPALEHALMPWIIASQTIPILAIAPMIIVVLGSVGLVGLLPKAIISAYLCFFPVAIGMVKGLTSPDPLQLDLIRTYSATEGQLFRKLRFPAAIAFLFASLKVAIALAIVGAIVGELPTGAQAGLGARMLSGSYYGQTVQIWAALIVAAIVSGLSIAAVGLAERVTMRAMGSAP
ncbi:MAG: transporter permease [Rhodospirillales bacterium]|jgi:NitT/TauT family transport system permease protein|nr:transporter permease [Rhodospirillales bacterium]